MNKRIVTSVLCFLVTLWLANSPARAAFVAEEVAEKAKNSVVTLEGLKVGYAAIGLAGGIGEYTRTRELVRNFGTGFIISSDGYVLSSEPQVRGSDIIEVTLADGTKAESEVVVLDRGWGVALLKIKNPPKGLKPVKWGDSDKVKQGDSVVVIGSAGGYGQTVSYGIVSARRPVRIQSGQLIQDMIQSDVVVNVGNRGSPLFNSKGEVIGMHAIEARSGFGTLQNVTFFLPSNLLKRLYPQYLKNKKPAFRPWLGILPYPDFNDALKMYIGMPDEYWDVGVIIPRLSPVSVPVEGGKSYPGVWPGSPAADAGLQGEDVILKIDGQFIKSIGDLEKIIYNAKEDQIMVFGIVRKGKYQELEVKIGNHPEERLPDFLGYI